MIPDVNVCVEGRGRRLRSAVAALAVAILTIVTMTELAAPPRWWAVLALPLFVAALQLLQAYTGVCVFHARRGTRVERAIVERVIDPKQRSRLARRGRRVLLGSLGLTAATTVALAALAAAR